MIICDLNKTPDLFQKPPQNCPKCENPVDGQYCQGCALLRKKFKEDLFTYCIENGIFQDFQDTFDPSNDNTNIVNALQEPFVVKQDPGKNTSQSLPQINHHCCYGCGDSLEDIFCHQCTYELYGKGAHYVYNCPLKVPIIPNPGPCNNQTIDELPQTLPSFDTTCYSEEGNSFTYDSKSNLVDDSPNVSTIPQTPTYSYEFCGNDAYYGYDCPLQVPFTYDPEPDDQSFYDEDISKEIYSNPLFDEEIISMKIDPHHFNAESDIIESLLNQDSLIISSASKIDSLLDEFAGELTLLKLIPPGINKTDCDLEEETLLIKKLFDSFMEEIDLSFTPDDPMPPGIEEDDYDSKRDILILEELLSNISLSFLENESFHFDIPSSSRPPAKPSDGNSGILNVKVMGDISKHNVPMPRHMLTQPTLFPNREKSPNLLSH
uniref:Uncharacterized protein n=1 Tax=Tanacetum cinerariifolium TaxID=118510 RepID=A0A6L2N458_TANCI|nr:hypothetical protein [Tanacetum cinerariifolium]